MLFDAKSIFAGGGRYRGSAEVREDQSGAVELLCTRTCSSDGHDF